jgi:hypothetical protein
MANNLELALRIKADTAQAYAELNRVASGVKSMSAAASGLTGPATDAGKAMTGLGSSARAAKTELANTRLCVEEIGESLQSAKGQVQAFIGVWMGMQQISSLVALADQYGQMASRIKMATSSTEEYEQVQSRLLDTAQNTYRPLAEAQEMYIRTADAIKSLGYNTGQALDVSDSLSYLSESSKSKNLLFAGPNSWLKIAGKASQFSARKTWKNRSQCAGSTDITLANPIVIPAKAGIQPGRFCVAEDGFH